MTLQNLQNLSVKDLIDAFSGATESARDAMPSRDRVLRAFGAQTTDESMMSSFGIFAAGIVLGAGLAVLFAPRSGTEVREAIGEKISNLRSSAESMRAGAEA
jgi:hypothetical protein